MRASGLGYWLLAATGFVVVVLLLDSSGLLSDDAAIVVDDVAQLAAGLWATVLCWLTARRLGGPERTWRRWMTFAMAGWSVGQALWSWYQIFSDTDLPSPSLADVGYLTLPVLALPALLVLASEPSHAVSGRRGAPLVFLLDALIVVGSLFILTWSTALGSVVRAGAPTSLAFTVAIAYPLTDLMLVVIVVLLGVTLRVPSQLRLQLLLLALGLVGLSVSDSIFAYIVSSGADEMPPITNVGFIAGPLLIGLAALAPAVEASVPRGVRKRWAIDRGHLLLPYVLVAVTLAVVGVQLSLGHGIDALETWIAWIVLGLVLVRQMVTLVENNALLERVSAAQAELAYRAQHDPLTGLANRNLFNDRLHDAFDRYRGHGWPFGLLLIDLDDFKAINDSLGHATGDRVLRAVGERLRGCVRSTDTVARIGGDEFAVVLEGTIDTPEIVGERILDALRNPFEIDGRLLRVGASLGLAEPNHGEGSVTADVLMQRADSAMYVGKRSGKGIAVRYRPDIVAGLDAPVPVPPAPSPSQAPPPPASVPAPRRLPRTRPWPRRLQTRR
jgi:diguanylate cyclase